MSSETIKLSEDEIQKYSCFDVLRLATIRSAELASFESAVNLITARAITPLQRLPVRLRRRAASHRFNRLPRRLHKKKQLIEKAPAFVCKPKHKLKCRRYNRRKLRLLALHTHLTSLPSGEQNCKPCWLPTHIWHAKRFHMITKWGWRLPQSPTNKVFKACHVASHNGCLVFDMSYLSCFQLSGVESVIADCVHSIFSPELSTNSHSPQLSQLKTPVHGCEQTGILYAESITDLKNITNPVLGPVRLLWGEPDYPNVGMRHLWFWLHPAMATDAYELIETIVKQLNLKYNQKSIAVTNLTGHFCRLRLLGRQSHALLVDLLKPIESSGNCAYDWLFWKQFSKTFPHALCVPPGMVITLSNCAKFTLERPQMKIHNRNWSLLHFDRQCEVDNVGTLSMMPSNLFSWSDVAESYSKLAPGHLLSTIIADSQNDTSLNVVLIQNATPSVLSKCRESIGWDVMFRRISTGSDVGSILKGSIAAREFLVACTYRGAEVGSLRDMKYWAGISSKGNGRFDAFPENLWPDTKAGQQCAHTDRSNKMAKLDRLPTCMRPNYEQYGINHPWLDLINSFNVEKAQLEYFVLRDKALLRLVVHRMLIGDVRAYLTIEQLDRFHSGLSSALVLVDLNVPGKGVPQPFAIIYGKVVPKNKRLVTDTTLAKWTTIGYVQDGGYNLSTGRGSGLGFISLASISTLVSSGCRDVLLNAAFKNPTSAKYRTTRLTVVT